MRIRRLITKIGAYLPRGCDIPTALRGKIEPILLTTNTKLEDGPADLEWSDYLSLRLGSCRRAPFMKEELQHYSIKACQLCLVPNYSS